MRRMLAIAAIFALVPIVAMAENEQDKRHGPPPKGQHVGPAHPAVRAPVGVNHGPVNHGPIGVNHGPIGVNHGPIGSVHVVGHGPWMFHGRSWAWHPVHYPHPWIYPAGYGYRLWAVGAILPAIFWSTPTYYYADWAGMGLPPPDPGFQYVEYGPDLLLVNVATGAVVEVFPGAFS
jgi:Ni/Co efflux regulator RcnB